MVYKTMIGCALSWVAFSCAADLCKAIQDEIKRQKVLQEQALDQQTDCHDDFDRREYQRHYLSSCVRVSNLEQQLAALQARAQRAKESK